MLDYTSAHKSIIMRVISLESRGAFKDLALRAYVPGRKTKTKTTIIKARVKPTATHIRILYYLYLLSAAISH